MEPVTCQILDYTKKKILRLAQCVRALQKTKFKFVVYNADSCSFYVSSAIEKRRSMKPSLHDTDSGEPKCSDIKL
jgi:predicted AAA+ superfamily ATPase